MGTTALLCWLEGFLRQSITSSGQCCSRTPLHTLQTCLLPLSTSLLTSCQHSPCNSPVQLQPSLQGAGEVLVQGTGADSCVCVCRDIVELGDAHVSMGMCVTPATASAHSLGATAAPSSAPSPCTRRWVGVTEPASASKYHTVTTAISYCAGAGTLPVLLRRSPASCDTQAVTQRSQASYLHQSCPGHPHLGLQHRV